MKYLTVPLTEELYARLRAESKRARRPAIILAREAIESWLCERRKGARHEEIAVFAAESAGTTADLDPDLERFSLEHLARFRKP